MPLLGGPVPIESDEHVLRARRTAALTRIAMGALGAALVIFEPALTPDRPFAIAGFAVILASALVQFAAPGLQLSRLEESISGAAGLLIVGFGPERLEILDVLWLVALAAGVLARGGRVQGIGRWLVLLALVLPVLRNGRLDADYLSLAVATLALLLMSGRMMRELNRLLREARLQADSAETLLLAGDIAARMRREDGPAEPAAQIELDPQERGRALAALARLVQGEGLEMAVQPIVDIRDGEIHAFEALARFGVSAPGATPLHWFALAEHLGGRPALERACLRATLELLGRRPAGTCLTVNLSAPVLLEEQTRVMLLEAAEREPDALAGLIIEITEETLVSAESELQAAIEPLRARGARLAVDDMGAGYSGLRQITTVSPSYLKLDRALVTGIDADPDRAALVAALNGYSLQVGSMLIAEGVETAAELAALRRIGVPLVQGFRLARPGEPWPQVCEPDEEPAPSPATLTRSEPIDPSAWPAQERTSAAVQPAGG